MWNEIANTLGFENEKELLVVLYKEWTMAAIADLIGVAESTIFYRLRKHNIKTRKRKMSVQCARKRGAPISQVKIDMIKRQFKLVDESNWAEIGCRCGVSEITAKKYALRE